MLYKALMALALTGFVLAGVQTYRLERVQALNAVATNSLQACGARLLNLLEDIADDRSIDNIPDGSLRNVPPHWMLPAPD